MPRIVVLVTPDAVVRDRIERVAADAGIVLMPYGGVREVLDRIRLAALLPAVVVLDERAVRWDGSLWATAQRVDAALARTPVVLYVPAGGAPPRGVANVHAVVTGQSSASELFDAITTAQDVPTEPPPLLARGSDRIDTREQPLDLHAYTLAKLGQYLGARRAEVVLRELTSDLAGQRIATTADLYRVAARLRDRGDVEATVATLLSGRATLLDSDRTLRRT